VTKFGIENYSVSPTGCHEYRGKARVGGGYAKITHEKRSWYGHRLSWTKKRGVIPKGMLVLHKCDNRICINPDHLFLGTVQDNHDDMRAKGRANYGKGESHSKVKLMWADVLRIREASRFSADRHDLAAVYGVLPVTVAAIARGSTRKYC
jgi:hypothetical protein